MELKNRLAKIKAFVFDVDGVLTDGQILATMDGELLRSFDSKDGFGLRMANMHDYLLGVITGGRSESITMRFKTCGINPENIYKGSRDKMIDFKDFCEKHGLLPDEVMYFGDDLPDIPVMRACGCGVAPNDAVQEVIETADYVSPYPGGHGCVRNTLEMVMRLQNRWNLNVEEYSRKF